MIKQILKRFTSLMLVFVLVFSLMPVFSITAFAADTALSGLSDENIGLTTDKSDAWSATGTTITGSVKGTSGTCSSSSSESTLTITNNKTVPAILSFSYKITQNDNSGTIQVAGTSVTADGTYSGELAAGASIKVYLKSAAGAYTTAVELSGISLIANVQATTTFQPAENGSYTVDGVEITEETTKTQQSTVAYSLAATPTSGYKFIGWYSVTEEKYLSSDTSATMYFDIDQTVTAVFTEEANPVFDVSGAKFTDLNEANEYAVTNSLSKIVLVSDGTLPSGAYTISSGVTLLIPFDSAYTCYTTTPANTGNVWTAPSVYKTLTMAEGASITVDGAISVSAKHYAYGQTGAGAPCGKYGYIYMNSGSSITVNSGGGLYVYGYVSGDGTVTAKSGATVYENMQICDFRGGSATSSMNNNAQKIFPLNQYFVQNIEAKLILESGADEYIYTSIYAASTTTSTAVHFIGNEGAMFSVEEGGYFTKQYLPDKDRLEINVSGNAKINNLTLTVMGITVSSSNYVLPITNCMTLNVLSGTTQITQDVALLAGVQVNIADGATVQVNEGASLYAYDHDEWTQANYASNAKFKTVLYSPTRTYTRTANDLIDACIDINGTLQSDGYVYTTAGGADITSSEGTGKLILTNGAGTETVTYMYKDYTTTYDEIPITSAKLHNGSQYAGTEEEYTLTDGAAAGSTYFWNSDDSKWKLEGETETITITFDANEGEGSMESQTVSASTDTALTSNTFTRTGYTFTGWNTDKDGNGTHYDNGATVNLTEDLTLYAQWQIWNGWYTDTIGTTYYVEGEQPYYRQWANIDGSTYYFNEQGYIVKGLYKTASQDGSHEATFVFDSSTGVFLSDKSGLHDVGADTYWIQNGEVVEYAGLIRIVKEDGEVNYYYFGEDSKAYKATEEQSHYLVEKTNGLTLPGGINYPFGEDGVIKHFADTSINGIYFDETSSNYYYCIDGVIIANGLMLVDGSYYYARTSSGAFVCGQSYWITKTNGLLDEGIYQFDETGKIVFPEETETKNGIVEENGSLYYYEDGVLTGAGLIRIGDDYYYVRTSTGEVVHGKTYWITQTNGLPIEAGQYQFADDGKMILPETEPEEPEDPEVKNGIVAEDGSLYYYVDGIRTGAGLIRIGDDYYYVRTSTGEVVHGRTYWITQTNGLPIEAGQYQFADDGKMIR